MNSSAATPEPPPEVLFAVVAWMVLIVLFDLAAAVVLFLGATGALPIALPLWAVLLIGFFVLLLSLIGMSFVLTVKDGDRNMRNYLSFTVVFYGPGFSWPPSWKWLLVLAPVVLVLPLWLPRSRRFFNQTDATRREPPNDRRPRGPLS